MKKLSIILLLCISSTLFSQTSSKLENIIQLGEEWKFDEAIELLKQEINIDSENPEQYYWLGRYSHYKVYDTRPFPGKSDQWSREQVLKPLQKAVELDPNYGDAKYFLAAEYGSRAGEALKTGNVEQYKKEFLDAKSWGAFPLHAIEHGRNIFKSCDTNSILVVEGDAHLNVLRYLQIVEGYRQDVSVVALAFLERPYYIKLIRDGVPGVYKPVPINMSDNLILEMHNYKWKENDVIIPVSEKTRKEYGLNDTISHLKWHVKPNVGKSGLRTSTAMLINILETNNWERPVYCTMYGSNGFEGLLYNMQHQGLTSKILPIEVIGTRHAYNVEKFESVMLNPENYKDYKDIMKNNQPRASYAFGQLSRITIIYYALFLNRLGEIEKSKEVVAKMNELMPPETYPLSNIVESLLEMFEEFNKKQLTELISDGKSIDEIITFIQSENIEESRYNLSESGITSFGYSLMNEGKPQEALKIFKLNTKLYPEGYNTWDSYGECLLKLGQKEEAIKSYQKSLELNPGNENAKKILKSNQ